MKVEERNHTYDQEEYLEYKGCKIYVNRLSWEEYDNKKDKWNIKKRINCTLYRPYAKYNTLNLVECNDGSPFSATSQAVNEAKWLVDYKIEQEIERKLFQISFEKEDMFKYNCLKIWDRIKVKEDLYENNRRI